MNAIETLMKAMDELGRDLDAEHLRPDPDRTDWDLQKESLAEIRATAEEDIAHLVDEAALMLGDPKASANLRTNASVLLGEVAAIFAAAHRESESARFFELALGLAPSKSVVEELEAGRREPESFARLVLARWHMRNQDSAAADRVLGALKRSVRDAALSTSVRKAIDRPRPITGVPPLFRINGFGLALYGSRDHGDDGSYVSTYCACALFIPIFPIAAYRVKEHGGGRYTFIAKEKLSPFARAYQYAALIGAAVLVAWIPISNWLGSAERQAQVAFEAAQEQERAGQVEPALAEYRRLADSAPESIAEACGDAIVRLGIARAPSPMNAEHVDDALRVLRAYEEMPGRARGHAAQLRMSQALGRWLDQIGHAGESAQRASVRVADRGRAFAGMAARADTLHCELGDTLAHEWPSEALHEYLACGSRGSERATSIVSGLCAKPSLLADATSDVRHWRDHAASTDEVDAALATVERWTADRARQRALEEGDAALLTTLHQNEPLDQEVAVALAESKRASGDVAGAREILESYGGPGQLIAAGQRALASCLSDEGHLADADALLSHQVDAHLPEFLEAQRAYAEATDRKVQDLLSRARAGLLPELDSRLQGADEEHGRAIFQQWMREQMEQDAQLGMLRDRYMEQAPIVATVLSLGTIKLMRARQAAPADRDRLLGDAERLFLAIRDEAEGLPTYHLSLGQVYYRLGREEEGERELQGVLEQPDLGLQIAVAHAYRELGQVGRAREVAERIYREHRDSTAPEEQEAVTGAVMLMVRLATRLEDEEEWLSRAPQDNPTVQIDLLSVRAQRARREGRLDEADRLFSQVVDSYEENASDPAAQNNAALARVQRYLCTGDIAQVDQALEQLEQALRLRAENPLAIGNLADLCVYRAQLRVLERAVRISVLRPDSGSAEGLVDAFHLDEALAQDPAMARARELTAQEQVLAPQTARAYQREWDTLKSARDLEGTRALLARMREVHGLDTSAEREVRERYERGEDREQMQAQMDAAVREEENVLAAARGTSHAPTIAAAQILLSEVLASRAQMNASLPDAERAASLLGEVQGVDVHGPRGEVMMLAAALRAMQSSRSIRNVWDAESRRISVDFILQTAAERDAALRPELRTALAPAAAELSQQRDDRLGADEIVIAELVGDAELERRARAGAEWMRASLDVQELLRPSDPGIAMARALLDRP